MDYLRGIGVRDTLYVFFFFCRAGAAGGDIWVRKYVHINLVKIKGEPITKKSRKTR